MGKGKLWKWEENAEMDNVFEPDLQEAVKGADHPYRGKWHAEVFGNDTLFLKILESVSNNFCNLPVKVIPG